MNQGLSRSSSRWRWKKKTPHRLLLFSISLFLILLFFFFQSRSSLFFRSSSSSSNGTLEIRFPQCGTAAAAAIGRERFLWYAPHSGFSNQLSEFKNALLMAAILNRTLVVPPVLDHHAVALGSCPKFRVSSPSELRVAVWDHIVQLVQSRRYVSMADIVDLSSIVPSMVKTIDFRVFVSKWCGLEMDIACSGRLWPVEKTFQENSKQCRSLLSGMEGTIDQCVYAVEEDCRTTVWIYQQNNDGILDPYQPDKELQRKKRIRYIRRRRDVYKAFGCHTKAEMATVLAFGSLFTAPYKDSELYIDIHEPSSDPRIQRLLKSTEFLPFVPEIISAGKNFALTKIREPFLCAQLRLLDGQFKNHWKTTFSALEQKIETLQLGLKEKRPIHIFVMTDLPPVNWTGNYLAELSSTPDSFKLHLLQEGDELVMQTATKLMSAERGLKSELLPSHYTRINNNRVCPPVTSLDILLYLEEMICSCASLGFVGTAGSTIAESIELMRRNNVCISSSLS